MPPDAPAWTAIVLSGGRSSRMGHDKARATLHGHSLLEHVVAALPADVPCILVGPQAAPLGRAVVRAVEADPDGGPVSGIACGLPHVATPLVVVVAVDMPFAVPFLQRLVAELATADEAVDGLVAVDPTGGRQQLVAAYRTPALRAAIDVLGGTRNRAVRELQAALRLTEVAAGPLDARDLLDIDTPSELEAARRSVRYGETATTREGTAMSAMGDWVTAVCKALDIEHDVDVDSVLDVAREVAHGVERPAAPVTTFLMGYAVAKGTAPADAAARLTELAREWPPSA